MLGAGGMAMMLLFGCVVARGQQSLTQEFIYTSAPFPSAHASTLVELRDGDVLAAWFGGSAEGKRDVAIWGARRAGGQWSAPMELVREPNTPCWNPVLFHSADGRLWLYYKFGPVVREWTGARMYSDDEGKTWSKPEHLPAGLLGPIKDKPLVLKDGVIVSGSSVESYASWAAWIERSTDNGRTWKTIGPITVAGVTPPASDGKEIVTGIIQPAVVQLGGKHLRFYARPSNDLGKIAVADSMDEGATWTQARLIDVVNPNSGIDAVGLRDGRVVLIYNDSPTERTPLKLAVSKDGEHFTAFATLESEPGEYSYPAIIQLKDGDLAMTYTWQRTRIRYAQVGLKSVPKTASNNRASSAR